MRRRCAFHSRAQVLRQRVIQPKVRSTTQRRGKILKPGSLSMRRTISTTKSLARGLVHELLAVIGAVGEEMFDPRPALADGVEDLLCASGVGDIRRCQIDHEQSSVRIHRNVALAPVDFLAGVIAPRLGGRRSDRFGCRRRRPKGSPRGLRVRDRSSAPRRGGSRTESAAMEAAKPPIDESAMAEDLSASCASRSRRARCSG